MIRMICRILITWTRELVFIDIYSKPLGLIMFLFIYTMANLIWDFKSRNVIVNLELCWPLWSVQALEICRSRHLLCLLQSMSLLYIIMLIANIFQIGDKKKLSWSLLLMPRQIKFLEHPCVGLMHQKLFRYTNEFTLTASFEMHLVFFCCSTKNC